MKNPFQEAWDAVYSQDLKLLQKLCSSHNIVNSSCKNGTLLHLAVSQNTPNLKIIDFLLEKMSIEMIIYSEPNKCYAAPAIALQRAVTLGGDWIIIMKKYLKRSNVGEILLGISEREDTIAPLELIFKMCESNIINYTNHAGDTALHYAAQNRQVCITEFLVNFKDARIDALNNSGENPLHNAIQCKNTDILAFFLNFPYKHPESTLKILYSLDTKDGEKRTPLKLAQDLDYKEIAEIITNAVTFKKYSAIKLFCVTTLRDKYLFSNELIEFMMKIRSDADSAFFHALDYCSNRLFESSGLTTQSPNIEIAGSSLSSEEHCCLQ